MCIRDRAILSGLPRQLAQEANPDFPRDGSLPALLQCGVVLAASFSGIALLAPLLAFLPALGNVDYLGRTMTSSWNETVFTLMTSACLLYTSRCV